MYVGRCILCVCEKITTWILVINPLKMWRSSNILERTQQIGTASIHKARPHRTQGMTATIRLRIVCRSGTACNQWNGIMLSCSFVLARQPPSRPGPPHSRGFYITHNDAPQSVGLLWTSDLLVAETSTWQHTTLTAERHPCPRWDLNPQSQQASGRRPTP